MNMKERVASLAAAIVTLALSVGSWSGEIHEAIARHDAQAVQQILKSNAGSIAQRDNANFTPLHLAAMGGDLEICKMLIVAGANVEDSTDGSAASQPVDAVAAQGKPVNQLSPGNQASVFNAAGLSGGFTALQLAAQAGHKKVVEYLLSIKADPNKRDPLKHTALHIAITNDHPEVALLLISKGADINVKESHGMTPLHYAAEARNVSVVEALLKSKANPKAKTDSGITPLISAIDWSMGEMQDKPYPVAQSSQICRLLAPVSDINAIYEDGVIHYTALLYAVRFMQYEIIKLLLENKADANITNKGGSTALDIADVMIMGTYDENDKPTDRTKEGMAIQNILKKYGGKNKKPYNFMDSP